jgi:hypothetical protein
MSLAVTHLATTTPNVPTAAAARQQEECRRGAWSVKFGLPKGFFFF